MPTGLSFQGSRKDELAIESPVQIQRKRKILRPATPTRERKEWGGTHMTASSPRALTVINIITPTMMKSIVCSTPARQPPHQNLPPPLLHPPRARARAAKLNSTQGHQHLTYQRTRTTLIQRTTRSNKQSRADGATNGNHLHMPILQLP